VLELFQLMNQSRAPRHLVSPALKNDPADNSDSPGRNDMNGKIQQLLDQITRLEDELNATLEEQQSRLRYQFEGRRVVFEQSVRDAHQRIKLGVFRWFLTIRPQNYLTMPITRCGCWCYQCQLSCCWSTAFR
jgi:hypothetical protein